MTSHLLEVKEDFISFPFICSTHHETCPGGAWGSWKLTLFSAAGVDASTSVHFMLLMVYIVVFGPAASPTCVNLNKTYVQHLGSIESSFIM
jgi:hypothetical protein